VAAIVAVFDQLRLAVVFLGDECLMPGQLHGNPYHFGRRLGAVGLGQDQRRSVPALEVRQLQATTSRRRTTTRDERTASTTQPQNRESVSSTSRYLIR